MEVATLQNEIRKLLRERSAILIAHYYEREEIQEIADILSDSLALNIEAARTDAAVVAYVNSSAAIKAGSDICCTSANAVKVVNSLTEAQEVLMIPDGNLVQYTAGFTGKKIIPWNGYCPVHHFLTPKEVVRTKALHPGAPFAAHPECRTEVLMMADFVGSTAGIILFAAKSPAREIILGTEEGVIVKMKKESPGKTFIPAPGNLACRTMKLTTLDDIRDALRGGEACNPGARGDPGAGEAGPRPDAAFF
jgi:quinolinate synthase